MIITVAEETQNEVTAERDQIAELWKSIESTPITNQAQLEWFDRLGKNAKLQRERLDAQRLSVGRPLLAAKGTVDGWFKPAIELYATVEDKCKEKISTYLLAAEQAKAEAMPKVLEAYQAGDTTAMTEALAVANADVPKLEGTTLRKRWSWTIINPGLVPYEFLSPDPEKIQAHAKKTPKNPAEPPIIPGVKFELVAGVAMSTGDE